MITKLMAAVMLTGALWVTGDAAYRQFDCCKTTPDCCGAVREKSGDCCSTPSRSSILSGKGSCCEQSD